MLRSALQGRIVRWQTWRTSSTNRSIAAAMLTVGGFTILVKLVSMAKELVVAHRFGIGNDLDAFFIAYLLPSFAVNVIAGSCNSALIPTYMQVRQDDGPEHAHRLFSNVMVWSTGLLLSITLLLALVFPLVLPLLGSNFSPQKLALTRSLFYILLPIITLSGLSTNWAALLNTGEKFALAAAIPIITPLVVIFALLRGASGGIYLLSLGTVLGAVLEIIFLGCYLKRLRISLIPRWSGLDAPTKQVMHQYAPMAAGAFLMSGTGLVDQSMSAMLGAGSVSALNYGNRLVTLIIGIATMAVGTAVMPYFSAMAAREDWAGIRHTLYSYLRLILIASGLATAGLVLLSVPLIRVFYQRGSFTEMDTLLVARIQMFYAFQIPFAIAGMLVVRLISSLRANKFLMRAAGMNLVVNALLDFVFMRWMGIAGIALSTSFVYLFSFIYCWIALTRSILPRSGA